MTYDSNDFPQANQTAPAGDAAPDTREEMPVRKPRIALMGEFSAGKSTLMNLMLGRPAVPTKVTATQLPPVWIAYGDSAPWREDLAGNRHPVDPEHLDEVPLHDTAFIRLFLETEVLEVCDLIDTPGISDPNMPPEVWQRAADEADGVIWLTHATQAWRQSEAAVWDEMPEGLRPRSLLLVTRFDKLLNQHDRDRVLHRASRETAGLFRAVLPISLTQALAAGDDSGKWADSGGEAFSDALLELIGEIEQRLRTEGVLERVRRPEVAVAPAPAGDMPQEAPAEDAEPGPGRPMLRAVEPDGLTPPNPGDALRAALHHTPAPRPTTGLRVVSPPDEGAPHPEMQAGPEPAPADSPEPAPLVAMPRRVAPSGATRRPPRPRG
ncbi:dynamin family protein [Frigidibacter sp. ROC022]|uniref:dynamin family protein n=1 Tax=Frigidibacter sp. ROC022 TaxID=2971796 RepID=UPI00215B2582|nr:dynamin family protein [Frigidibacter sp. ROC022]MCR8725022.1 dynamin family protein [Frigidibacter sp. ROC022]